MVIFTCIVFFFDDTIADLLLLLLDLLVLVLLLQRLLCITFLLWLIRSILKLVKDFLFLSGDELLCALACISARSYANAHGYSKWKIINGSANLQIKISYTI